MVTNTFFSSDVKKQIHEAVQQSAASQAFRAQVKETYQRLQNGDDSSPTSPPRPSSAQGMGDENDSLASSAVATSKGAPLQPASRSGAIIPSV